MPLLNEPNTPRPLNSRRVYIETYGCQMNVADTEVVGGILTNSGYVMTSDMTQADVLLLNTCAIRENAHTKIYTHLSDLRALKKTRPLVVGVLGCMAQNLKATLVVQHDASDVKKLPAFPAAAVYGRFLLKAGSGAGWVGFDGNADNLLVGISSVETLFDFEGDCTTSCYVRTDGNDANTGLADTASQAKKTIQAAVNQVSAGGTVHVAAGTYVEQVDIGKQLTLDGAGAGSTIIQSPAVLATKFTTSAANKPVVYVHASGGTISHLTVDGNGVGNANYRFEGIAFYNAGGTVANSAIVATDSQTRLRISTICGVTARSLYGRATRKFASNKS